MTDHPEHLSRLVGGQGGEDEYDSSLRPASLDDFVGQRAIVENMRVFVRAASMRGQSLDHVLLCGPPGLGKTTLAFIIARELGVNIRATSAPVIDKAGDLASILTSLEDRDVLFIDEIHRLSSAIEEVLYPAMEDRSIDIIIGQGVGAKSIKIDLARFTLIGATTRAGLLTAALRDRFGIPVRLDYYTDDDLATIAVRSAKIMNVPITADAAFEVARRSRKTPRIVNRLLKRVYDFSMVESRNLIDMEIARYALERLEIDEKGLDIMDRTILKTIIEKFDGGPVGIKTIAISLGEEIDTLEDFYEPYLVQIGFIKRTPRGRMATELAYRHLGFALRDDRPASLFNDNS